MKLFVLSTLFVTLSVSKSIPKLIQQETQNGQQRQLLSSGSCSIVTEYTLGVTDQNHCKTVGWTYCESTDECIAPGTKASCPVCHNGDIYCKKDDSCCDYDCNQPQQICVENDEHYTEGVQNVARCHGDYAGYNWCPSTGSCIEPGSISCPQCPSDTEWCQLLGGGHCCNFKNDECTNKNGQRRLGGKPFNVASNANGQIRIQSVPSESTGLCLTVQSITGGVTDKNNCPTLGWTYCESTDECIAPGTRASCPVCQNGYFYCKDTDNCCDYDCTQQRCVDAEDYTEGVSNVSRCHGVHLGEKWCESLGQCIESGSISCPQCPDNTEWCQLLGGGHCCNFKNDQCTNH